MGKEEENRLCAYSPHETNGNVKGIRALVEKGVGKIMEEIRQQCSNDIMRKEKDKMRSQRDLKYEKLASKS